MVSSLLLLLLIVAVAGVVVAVVLVLSILVDLEIEDLCAAKHFSNSFWIMHSGIIHTIINTE